MEAPDRAGERSPRTVAPATPQVAAAATVPSNGTRLSRRAHELLPLLRCPDTGEPLEADGGGLRSVPSGRRWPWSTAAPS